MGLRDAVAFLSRIPLASDRAQALPSSVAWFPIAGAVVGMVVGLLAALWFAVFPAWLAAVLFLPTYFGVKGILHTDGLADTADALAVHGGPERRQAVLRDPRIGVAGALAVVLFVVALLAAVYELPRPNPSSWLFAPPGVLTGGPFPWTVVLAVTLAEVAGVTAMLIALRLGPLAPESRIARALRPGLTRTAFGGGLVAAGVLLVILGGTLALGALVLLLLFSSLGAILARRAFGGVSGDLLGATHDLTFVAVLLLAATVAWTSFL